MPKLKTHQGAAKRFRKTKTGKIMHRTSGQDHFNSRETGKVGTNKRRDISLSGANRRVAKLIVHK